MWPFNKRVAERRAVDSPKTPSRVVVYRNGRPLAALPGHVSPSDAIKHPVVSRCLRYVARAVQTVEWFAEAEPGSTANKRIVEDLNKLLAHPAEGWSGSNLKYWLAVTLASYGTAPYKVGTGASGTASGIYTLDPAKTRVEVDSRGRVKSYIYGSASTKQVFDPRREEVVQVHGYAAHIAIPSLSGSLVDTAERLIPLAGANTPAAVVNSLLHRTFLTAEGSPVSKYIISVKDAEMSTEQQQEVEEYIGDFEPGGDSAGQVMFMNGDVKAIPLAADLSDSHSKEPLDDMTRMIVGQFGIPIALWGLGAADAAKFAGNFAESRAAFYQDTIIPEYLTPIAEGLTRAICPEGVRIRFNIDTIDALLDSRVKVAAALNSVSFLTENEKREMLGFSPREET